MSMINEFKTKLKALMEEYDAEICLSNYDDYTYDLEVDLGPEGERTYSNLLHEFTHSHIHGNADGMTSNNIQVK